MRGDVVATCEDGYAHRYKEVWRQDVRTTKNVHRPPHGGIQQLPIDYKQKVTISWWMERCERCGTYRGARPDQMYYALTKENAQSAISYHFERWEREAAVEALAGI